METQARRTVPAPTPPPRPKLAVWKFASCDGCQLTLFDCEDELLALAAQVDIVHFAEATRADAEGPYDVSLERNMRCGVAECGHCQLGPLLLCRDGPVISYDVAAPLLAIREL